MKKIISVKVSEELYNELKRKAKIKNKSISHIVREMLESTDMDEYIRKDDIMKYVLSLLNILDANENREKRFVTQIRREVKKIWKML